MLVYEVKRISEEEILVMSNIPGIQSECHLTEPNRQQSQHAAPQLLPP